MYNLLHIVDKRIALIILFILILINVIFFIVVKPFKSSHIKQNHTVDPDDVVFITDEENYWEIEELDLIKKKESPFFSNKDKSAASDEKESESDKPASASDESDTNERNDDPSGDTPPDNPPDDSNEPPVPDPFLD